MWDPSGIDWSLRRVLDWLPRSIEIALLELYRHKFYPSIDWCRRTDQRLFAEKSNGSQAEARADVSEIPLLFNVHLPV